MTIEQKINKARAVLDDVEHMPVVHLNIGRLKDAFEQLYESRMLAESDPEERQCADNIAQRYIAIVADRAMQAVRNGDRVGVLARWHQILIAAMQEESWPGQEPNGVIEEIAKRIKSLVESDPVLQMLIWLNNASPAQAVLLHETKAPEECRKLRSLSEYKESFEIEALAQIKKASFWEAQQALLRCGRTQQKDILSNQKVQAIARDLARKSLRDGDIDLTALDQ